MAREENTSDAEIAAWIAKGNKVTVLEPFAKTDPADIQYTHKTQRTKTSQTSKEKSK
jgi:hypothetical protein|tara:strand:+ start:194 stop:364 length:171 start_codon:yes stop_codon:yes gene_type:complete